MNDASPALDAARPVRFTASEYLRMDDAGVFARFVGTELIEGEIFAVNAQHRPHSRVKMELTFRLCDALTALGSPLYPLGETSVALTDDSVPQPDIVLTSEPSGPGPIPLRSVALIVEVSSSTLAFDTSRKAAVYASAGVPEYWVVDVEGRVILQHHDPGDARYAFVTPIAWNDPTTAATIPGLTIATTGL